MINLQLILALVLNAVALLATAYIVPGLVVADFTTALLAAIVLGAANTFVRPALSYLTAPLNAVTLGLFSFVVSAALLLLVDSVVEGLTINGWVPAVLAAVVLSVVSTVLSVSLKDLAKLGKGK